MVSENYWQKRFSGDRAILGKTVYLNGVAVTIIGITPRDFVGTAINTSAFWLPAGVEPLMHGDPHWLEDRENRLYRLFGRLAPGASIGRAQAEMSSVADRLRKLLDPRSVAAERATMLVWPGSPFPLPLRAYGGLTLAIFLIMAAAVMVLTVACANVGSLQLARARSREHELRTRLCLGASRLRLIRQLITESALVGLLAGLVAFLFSWAFLEALMRVAANALPVEYGTLVFHVTPDLAIFAFVFAVSLIAGMFAGLAPAMESSRFALVSASRGATSSIRSRRVQDVLIATQVAFSLLLLVAGSIAIRSSIQALRIDPGYDSKRLLSLDLQFPEEQKYSALRKLSLVDAIRSRLAATPGVTALTSAQPPGDSRFQTLAIAADRETSSAGNVEWLLHYSDVQADYFQTLGIPMLLGRTFEPRTGQGEYSIILSESAAKQLWPGQNPIGRRLRLGITDKRFHSRAELSATGPAYRVVGVVRDTRGAEFDGSDSKRIYLSVPENRLGAYPVLIRTESNAAQLCNAVNAVVSSADPDIVATCSTLQELIRQSPLVIGSSIVAAVASAMGLFGLLLACMGIYGTVSYIVVLRTREVGIRMALGAQKSDVFRLILGESARPVLAGLMVGILLGVGASYLARGLLYGLDGVDGISMAGVSLSLFGIALVASYPPARRAMSVDPMVALRHE
jgi:predicted permease